MNQYKKQQTAAKAPYYQQMAKAQSQLAQLKPSEMLARTNYMNEQLKNTEFKLNNPLYGQPGVAGQLGAAELLKKHPELSSNPDAINLINEQIKLNQQGKQAATDLIAAKAKGYGWNQLPAETKNGIIAQGLGMGVDPIKMQQYVGKGLTIDDIAKQEGLDPNNLPSPLYFPTTATKTYNQKTQQIGAELDYMSSKTTPIISQYADTFAGYSPERLKDMMSNDPEAQKRYGRYVGALAIQNELASGRINLAGGKSGVELNNEIRNKSLAGIDQHSPIKMSKIAYQEAQKTIDEILQGGAKIRRFTGMNPFAADNRDISNNVNKTKSNDIDYSKLSDDELMKMAQGG